MFLQSYSSPLEKSTTPGLVSHVIMNKPVCIMYCCNCSGLSSSTDVSTITCHHSLYLLVIHHLPLGIHLVPLGIHHHLLGIRWVPPCLLGIHNLPPGFVVSTDALPFHHECLPWACCLPVLDVVTWCCQSYNPSRYHMVLYLLQSLLYLCSLWKLGTYASITMHVLLFKGWKAMLVPAPFTKCLYITNYFWFCLPFLLILVYPGLHML